MIDILNQAFDTVFVLLVLAASFLAARNAWSLVFEKDDARATRCGVTACLLFLLVQFAKSEVDAERSILRQDAIIATLIVLGRER